MEFVYVVPREELFPDCYPQGLVPFGTGRGAGVDTTSEEAFQRTVRERGFFVEREVAERTPTWKQVIPYTVVTRGDEVLLLRRLRTGGEARLHDKLSIGVGGHINPEDLDDSTTRDPVAAGTRRELEEELLIEGPSTLTAVGILNDDSNPVGAVHVGLVQVLELSRDSTARIREADILEGSFTEHLRLPSLLADGADFETWSALLIRRLGDILAPAPAPLSR